MNDHRAMRCCDSPIGISRREFLRAVAAGAAVLGAGTALAACGGGETSHGVDGWIWRNRSDAPFVRHAHSGAVFGSLILVMGDRRGVTVEADSQTKLDTPVMTVEVRATEFDYSLDAIEVPRGQPVKIVITNDGRIEHDIVMPEAGLYLAVAPGETAEGVAVFEQPETFFCSIGGHAESGMVGDLLVDGNAAEDTTIEEERGETDMWYYDPSNDTWSEAPTLPHSFDHVSFVQAGEAVFSIGGFSASIGSARAEVYSLAPGDTAWQRKADLPTGRGGMASAGDGRKIYVTGGRSEPEGTPSAQDVFVYDIASDRWDRIESVLPTGRDHVAGAIMDDVFWVVGGRLDGRRESSAPVTEGLDLATGQWLVGQPLPYPESAGGVAALGERVVVFGGEGPAATPAGAAGRSFVTYDDAYAYDPRTDRWQRVSDMPLGVHHAAYGVVEGRLYTIGGGPVSGVSATATTMELSVDL